MATRPVGAPVEPIDAGWERWIATNLAKGFAEDVLVMRMTARGVDEVQARAVIGAVRLSPIFTSLRAAEARAGKLERLLNTQGRLRALRGTGVARIAPSESWLFRDSLLRNEPVVIEGLAREWPTHHRWTFPYLRDVIGDTPVQITAGRDADSRFEDNFAQHVTTKSFADFIDKDVLNGGGNDSYLVSKNKLFQHPAAAGLLKDIVLPVALLSQDARVEDASVWIGPAGTLTPLHHDACNILFVQIRGRKRVWLIAPCYLPRLYNDRTCFSDVNPAHIDRDRFPLAADVPVEVVDLHEGDALLLPVGWWHQVHALDPSISLSLSSLDLPRPAHVWNWRKEGR